MTPRLAPLVACAGLLAAAQEAAARQAFSVSMVECAVILDEFARLGDRRGKDVEEVARLHARASAFLQRSLTQAANEGQPDPHAHVEATLAEKRAKWDGRLSRLTLLTENRDWFDYCRAFGRDQGIE